MSSDPNVIEETEDLRVKLKIDMDADQPYDDGSPPIVRIDARRFETSRYSTGSYVEHIDTSGRNKRADGGVEAAIERWGTPSSDDWDKVEIYLRAWHGVTKIDTYRSDDYWYIAYDSADWREYVGFGAYTEKPMPYAAEDFLGELKAWINGETYGYILERRVHVYQDQRRHSAVEPYFETAESEYDDWEEIESCWGFYGYEYAEEEAKMAFDAAKEKL